MPDSTDIEQSETEPQQPVESAPEASDATTQDTPTDLGPESWTVDPELYNTRDLALAALHEITAASTIGDPAGERIDADRVLSLLWTNTLPGYPGWFWTVTVTKVPGDAPTVLEAELLPGDGALVAPEWVPWAERLAEYQAVHAEQARKEREAAEAAEDQESDDAEDEFDDSEEEYDADVEDYADEDDDQLASVRTHAGDVDGVDIDELDPDDSAADFGDDDEDDNESDDDAGDSDVDED